MARPDKEWGSYEDGPCFWDRGSTLTGKIVAGPWAFFGRFGVYYNLGDVPHELSPFELQRSASRRRKEKRERRPRFIGPRQRVGAKRRPSPTPGTAASVIIALWNSADPQWLHPSNLAKRASLLCGRRVTRQAAAWALSRYEAHLDLRGYATAREVTAAALAEAREAHQARKRTARKLAAAEWEAAAPAREERARLMLRLRARRRRERLRGGQVRPESHDATDGGVGSKRNPCASTQPQ